MKIVLYSCGVAFFVGFLLIVFRGAPYVPTHKKRAQKAFDLLDVPAGSTILDLGSGDGVVLKIAAERGLRAIGYELNPFLCVISWLRCWRYKKLVTIRWRDFWLTALPPDVDAVFVFLAGPYMGKLQRKLTAVAAKRSRPLVLVSYGFEIPGYSRIRHDGDLHVYKIAPQK